MKILTQDEITSELSLWFKSRSLPFGQTIKEKYYSSYYWPALVKATTKEALAILAELCTTGNSSTEVARLQ